MSDDDETYSVGYGKPPKEHQFKPGKSGNPKGRPKGSGNIYKMILKQAAKKVLVVENGVKKKMAKIDVVFASMLGKGANGDVPAGRLVTNMTVVAEQMLEDAIQSGYSDEDLKVMLAEADWQKMLVDLKEEQSD